MPFRLLHIENATYLVDGGLPRLQLAGWGTGDQPILYANIRTAHQSSRLFYVLRATVFILMRSTILRAAEITTHLEYNATIMASNMSSFVKVDNGYAIALRSLHQPGNPLILANTYDVASTKAILSLNTEVCKLVKAIATTSNAIAGTLGIADADLSLSQNIAAHAEMSPLVRAAGIPFSMDLQDGYGDELVEAMKAIIKLGIVGANIEDCYTPKGWGLGMESLRPSEESVERIRTAVRVAKEMDVPDFVINARTDILRLDPVPDGWTRQMQVSEAVKRGKAFLDAGAVCVFVWGGAAGNITDEEIKIFVEAFGGKLAVRLTPGKEGLSPKELAEMGVCRVSVGGGLQGSDLQRLKRTGERVLSGGQLWSESNS